MILVIEACKQKWLKVEKFINLNYTKELNYTKHSENTVNTISEKYQSFWLYFSANVSN